MCSLYKGVSYLRELTVICVFIKCLLCLTYQYILNKFDHEKRNKCVVTLPFSLCRVKLYRVRCELFLIQQLKPRGHSADL